LDDDLVGNHFKESGRAPEYLFRTIKNGGKRMSLAATGIDFNRILLSA